MLKSLAFVQSSCIGAGFQLQTDTQEGVEASLESKKGKPGALDRTWYHTSLVSQVSNLKTGFERQNAPGNGQIFVSLLPEFFSYLIGCELVPHEHRLEAENENIQLLMCFTRIDCCFSSEVAPVIS